MEMNLKKSNYWICKMIFGKVSLIFSLFQNFKDTNTADDWIQASEYNTAVIR